MDVLRTPDERFAELQGYPFLPNYVQVGELRMHYVDEGDPGGQVVLMLHGEPTWSYLYRKMIPPTVAAGFRAVAPDLVGFGRSDKPGAIEDYTYQRHIDWMTAWLEAVDLRGVTLFCQDWGALIGLRLVAENPDRFARVVVSNGGLPTGDQRLPEAFFAWRSFALNAPELPVGAIVRSGSLVPMPADVMAAYDAPFPDETFKAGARAFPALVPASPDDPAAAANRRAWEMLGRWEKPFLTAFSDGDPITAGGDAPLRKLIPGAHGQPHVTIVGGGHFVQEDRGEELANVLLDFIRRTS